MKRWIDRVSLWSELLGGVLLMMTACASDSGFALRPTLMTTALSLLILSFGVLGRELCSKRGRALRRRLAAPIPAHYSAEEVLPANLNKLVSLSYNGPEYINECGVPL